VTAVSSHGNATLPSPLATWRSIPHLAGFQNSANVGGTDVRGATSLAGGLRALASSGATTAGRALLGIGIGGCLGTAVGIVIGRVRAARHATEAVLLIGALLPLLGMVPLFALWFGETSKGVIIFVAVATFLTSARAASGAVANLPREYSEFGQTLGAARLRAFLNCLPGVFPELRSGLRAAVILGLATEITGEIFGVQSGLGYILEASFRYGHVDQMMTIGIEMAAMGLLCVVLFDAAWSYVTRWSE
jgi:sulfonate transport system permease protein